MSKLPSGVWLFFFLCSSPSCGETTAAETGWKQRVFLPLAPRAAPSGLFQPPDRGWRKNFHPQHLQTAGDSTAGWGGPSRPRGRRRRNPESAKHHSEAKAKLPFSDLSLEANNIRITPIKSMRFKRRRQHQADSCSLKRFQSNFRFDTNLNVVFIN